MSDSTYLHGFTPEEQDRLYRQARYLAPEVHDRLPFRSCRRLLEVGCGVAAQTELLLRHFPDLHVTGVDSSAANLQVARARLEALSWAKDAWELHEVDAARLPFQKSSFDGAFLCWILEHVKDPARVLSEVRRVLRSGSPIVCTEVQNASFFVDPYSPNTLAYWMAFNDYQFEVLDGDPFVGAKLGNLLLALGYRDIQTEVKTFHLDNRRPGDRADFLAYWSELLQSGAPGLVEAGKVEARTVEAMKAELDEVARNPNAVFWYSFVQARAVV